MSHHLLSWVIFLPFLGALLQVLGFALREDKSSSLPRLAIGGGLVSSLLSSVLGIGLVFSMDRSQAGLQFRELTSWVGAYSIQYDVALDGLNALIVLLISIVLPIFLASQWGDTRRSRAFFCMTLSLQGCLLGAAISQDLFLQLFFWGASVLPVYFLISMWGGEKKEEAAFRFLMISSIGNALFFLSLLLMYYAIEPHTLSLSQFIENGPPQGKVLSVFGVDMSVSLLAFLFFSFGLVFRIPIWPCHGWFTGLVLQAPVGVSIVFCGAVVPVGLYIFSRVSLSLFPGEMQTFSSSIIFLALINMVFGALGSAVQADLKKFFAYLCFAEVGVILLGIGTLRVSGLEGAVFLLLSVGLSLAGLGFVLAALLKKLDTLDLNHSAFGGLIRSAPIMAFFSAVAFAALLGFPGFSGFVGQSLVFMGGYSQTPWSLLVFTVALLVILYGVFSVYRRIFLGGFSHESTPKVSDFSHSEKLYLFPMLLALIALGVFPKLFLDLIRPTVKSLVSLLM